MNNSPAFSIDVSDALLAVFHQAQEEGRVGPGPVERQLEHAVAFANILQDLPNVTSIVDLGSGGGLPGLVVAEKLPELQILLLDGRIERARALERAVETLGWGDRVKVIGQRAEESGRRSELRFQFDAVVARSFARPSVTAECASPLLRAGGHFLVAEPPDPESTTSRWPAEGCAKLGLEFLEMLEAPFSIAHLRQVEICDERYPRRVGIPEKRPLF